jgi:assimilatory nitrate reductase catalytic subunit
VTPVATFWRGMLLRRTEFMPTDGSYYWARIPLKDGPAFELAGWEPLPSGRGTEAWITNLLGAPPSAELIVYADPGRGVFRYASVVGDRLDACLFLARRAAELPAREALITVLSQEVLPEARLTLLAGRAEAELPIGDAGRTICACFAVGLSTIYRAITERRLTSISEIGRTLRAGTNCGSCIPELRGILRILEVRNAAG